MAVSVSFPFGAMGVSMLALVACSPGESTEGERGIIRLAYSDSELGCMQECSLATPLAEGSRALVEIVGYEALTPASARAQDEAVATIASTYRSDLFIISGISAGSTSLEFLDEAGAVLDRVPIHVRAVGSIEPLDGVGLVRATAEPIPVQFLLRDEGGGSLRGLGGVSYDSTGNVSVRAGSVIDLLEERMTDGAGPALRRHEHVQVRGDLSGDEGTITATALSGAERTIVTEAVAPQVVSVELTVVEDGNDFEVDADLVIANAGPGIYACCEWTFAPIDAPVFDVDDDCTAIRFSRLDRPARRAVELTCQARDITQTVRLDL